MKPSNEQGAHKRQNCLQPLPSNAAQLACYAYTHVFSALVYSIASLHGSCMNSRDELVGFLGGCLGIAVCDCLPVDQLVHEGLDEVWAAVLQMVQQHMMPTVRCIHVMSGNSNGFGSKLQLWHTANSAAKGTTVLLGLRMLQCMTKQSSTPQ
jgi:hypothetical protein